MELNEILEKCQHNNVIYDSFIKAHDILLNHGYQNIMVSVSGGADSDIMVDMCERLGAKVHYVFFNTGIEYQATLEHLDYLENKYDITIERIRSNVPVPLGCQTYGLPFLSKFVSDMISTAQRKGFKFEDKPYEELLTEYPRSKKLLKWWCNGWMKDPNAFSRFQINFNKGLKEFLVANPPQFKISDKCCEGAKKNVGDNYIKEHNIDLRLVGVRKSEGGIRANAYKTCFDETSAHTGIAVFRPIFWYTDQAKKEYEEIFDVVHSKCYTEYGLKRTGCCGCPFGKNYKQELDAIKDVEPKLFMAVNNIFGEAYEYIDKFQNFKKEYADEIKRNSETNTK